MSTRCQIAGWYGSAAIYRTVLGARAKVDGPDPLGQPADANHSGLAMARNADELIGTVRPPGVSVKGHQNRRFAEGTVDVLMTVLLDMFLALLTTLAVPMVFAIAWCFDAWQK
jgi:hypothetical protein